MAVSRFYYNVCFNYYKHGPSQQFVYGDYFSLLECLWDIYFHTNQDSQFVDG